MRKPGFCRGDRTGGLRADRFADRFHVFADTGPKPASTDRPQRAAADLDAHDNFGRWVRSPGVSVR